MKLAVAVCRFSEKAEAAIGDPWAIPAYVAVSALMQWLWTDDLITLALSHFANLALILMSIAGQRRAKKQERQLDELARVNPQIDDKAIAAEVA